ncbi:MAG: hypothetical protein HY791_34875 [Deltaproteobacteria bacterium]|nr:hypothetical protein [Deltaproteobacteria bacterium]
MKSAADRLSGWVHAFRIQERDFVYDVHRGSSFEVSRLDGQVANALAEGAGADEIRARLGPVAGTKAVERSLSVWGELARTGRALGGPPNLEPERG